MQRVHDVTRKYLERNVVRLKESYYVKHRLTHYKPVDFVMYAMESGQLDVVHN